MTGSFVGRGNKNILLVNDLYCKLGTIVKQLLTFLHKVRHLNHCPQRWEASMFHCTTVTPSNPSRKDRLNILSIC